MGDIWPSWASPGEAAADLRFDRIWERSCYRDVKDRVRCQARQCYSQRFSKGPASGLSKAPRLGEDKSACHKSARQRFNRVNGRLPHSCFSAAPASIACGMTRLRCLDAPIDGNLYGPIAVSRAVFSHRFLRLQFVSRYSHARSRWTRKSWSGKGILASLSSGEHHRDRHFEPPRHRWVAVYGVGLSAKAHVCLHL